MNSYSAAPADVALATVHSARVAVLAVNAPASAFLVLNTSSEILGSTRANVFLLPLALIVIGLQLYVSLAAVRGGTPGRGLLAWLVIVACVTILVLVVGPANLPGLWFIAATGAIVLPPRIGATVLVASVLTFVLLAVVPELGGEIVAPGLAMAGWLLYASVSGVAGAYGPYVAARLLPVVEELARTRAELALTAADQERRRLSRDLHDALGQGLSAVALKGDLALVLAGTDHAAAGREIRSLVTVAATLRRELPVIVDAGHTATYAVEASRAEALLRVAGIHVEHRGRLGPLSAPVDATLGWVVREAATNVLRHSDAKRWTLHTGRSEDGLWLEASNDRPRPAGEHAGAGLQGMAERLEAIGGRLDVRDGQDRFTLRVEVVA